MSFTQIYSWLLVNQPPAKKDDHLVCTQFYKSIMFKDIWQVKNSFLFTFSLISSGTYFVGLHKTRKRTAGTNLVLLCSSFSSFSPPFKSDPLFSSHLHWSKTCAVEVDRDWWQEEKEMMERVNSISMNTLDCERQNPHGKISNIQKKQMRILIDNR